MTGVRLARPGNALWGGSFHNVIWHDLHTDWCEGFGEKGKEMEWNGILITCLAELRGEKWWEREFS